MPKTKVGEVGVPQEVAVVSLAFRVIPDNDGLFAAEMLLLKGDTVMKRRHGLFTTLGHAIGAADDLMDGWAFNEIEQAAEDYFSNVFM